MILLTFETTHDALLAEQKAGERRLGAQVVPAPAAAGAKCGLALECLPEDMAALTDVLGQAGVRYGVFVRSDAV
jgi:hypothetical protein